MNKLHVFCCILTVAFLHLTANSNILVGVSLVIVRECRCPSRNIKFYSFVPVCRLHRLRFYHFNSYWKIILYFITCLAIVDGQTSNNRVYRKTKNIFLWVFKIWSMEYKKKIISNVQITVTKNNQEIMSHLLI